jgi:hypothetical protein
MTNSKNAPSAAGFPGRAAVRVSMISMMAISIGIVAAPAQAQSMVDPSDMPMQSPVAAPALAPVPVTQPAPVTIMPTPEAKRPSPAPSDRANALATDGGFDATTVAPEAMAQIEAEKQARKAAAAKSAAATKAAAAERSAALARNDSAPTDAVADNGTDGMADTPASSALAAVEPAPVAGFESGPAMIDPVPLASDTAATPADSTGDADWTLLAALAGLLGLGGVGAYAASRRRKSKAQPAAHAYVAHKSEPETVAVAAATMPELRREPVVEAGAENDEQGAAATEHLAGFVAGLPSFEEPRSKADHNITLGQRRVAAAPRPYLGEADVARRPGYFAAHVDAIPTPQNPFLTRQKRLKRARYLEAKLAEMKAAQAMNPTGITGNMQVTRPMTPAYG